MVQDTSTRKETMGGREALVSERSARKPDKRGRRMALLRRAGLFGVDTEGAVIRRAVTAGDLVGAYRLVHEAFLERGYIRPMPGELRIRPFEALPSMATFVADADGEIVGVQGLAVDDPDLGLPSDGAFKAEIDALRRGGRLVCEATNQAVAPAYRKSAVATELMRAMFAHALLAGCDELITTVSPGHARFFELLGFEKASPVRSYSAELDDPTILMRVNVAQLLEWVEAADDRSDAAALFIKVRCVDGNPYREQVADWAEEAETLFGRPWDLRDLFAERSGLLDRVSDEARTVIRARWGAEVFDDVAAPALAVG